MEKQFPQKLVVCCAIIQKDGKILIAKKMDEDGSGRWEFPGGKMKENETLVTCLKRELIEEMELSVEVLREFPPVSHNYPGKSVLLFPFLCYTNQEISKLNDHSEIRWLPVDQLDHYDLLEADRTIVDKYLK